MLADHFRRIEPVASQTLSIDAFFIRLVQQVYWAVYFAGNLHAFSGWDRWVSMIVLLYWSIHTCFIFMMSWLIEATQCNVHTCYLLFDILVTIYELLSAIHGKSISAASGFFSRGFFWFFLPLSHSQCTHIHKSCPKIVSMAEKLKNAHFTKEETVS